MCVHGYSIHFRSANKYQTYRHKPNEPIDLLQTANGCPKPVEPTDLPDKPSIAELCHPCPGALLTRVLFMYHPMLFTNPSNVNYEELCAEVPLWARMVQDMK